MLIKKSVIYALANILSSIKINKLVDKDTKATLIKEYLQMKKILKDLDEERDEVVLKFRTDWEDELPKVAELRKKSEPVVGHDAFLEAEKDANDTLAALYATETEVDFTPIALDKFISAIGEEDLTLDAISFLQECGIVE